MKKAKMIILAGQSNAVGVGYTACLPRHFSAEKLAEYDRGYEKIKINYFSHDLKSRGFVPTGKNCTEATKDTFGPELGMAEYLHEKDPESEYYIVKCAFGGKSLHWDFLSPSSGMPYDAHAHADGPVGPGWAYNELVSITRDSLKWLEAQRFQPQIIGFCWMQGETDACTLETAERYGLLYENFIADIKSEFALYMKDCQFVDAGISHIWSCFEPVNRAKLAYAQSHESCHYIDTVSAGLTTEHEPLEAPDIAHYDSNSTIQLGKLFAQTVIENQVPAE